MQLLDFAQIVPNPITCLHELNQTYLRQRGRSWKVHPWKCSILWRSFKVQNHKIILWFQFDQNHSINSACQRIAIFYARTDPVPGHRCCQWWGLAPRTAPPTRNPPIIIGRCGTKSASYLVRVLHVLCGTTSMNQMEIHPLNQQLFRQLHRAIVIHHKFDHQNHPNDVRHPLLVLLEFAHLHSLCEVKESNLKSRSQRFYQGFGFEKKNIADQKPNS